MKPERWQKIRRICEDALERKAGDREAYLRNACAGDDQLRAEVDSFLFGAVGQDGFIETPAIEMAAKAITQDQARHEMRDLTGETFLHYRITGKIGAGGMGDVYRARDDRLKRDVAIKVLPDLFTEDPDRLARFNREAMLLASLNHPNIASIYGIEQAGTKRFLVLELVEGETLAQRLASGPLPLEEAMHISRQIADGLQAAHEKGIIHRDLKPANVEVTSEGRVKVLDFGLAKAIGETERKPDASQATTITGSATSAWQIVGTPGYMSPEQARGADVDQRADIWAFGCLLFELLSGKRAFKGESVSDTIAAVLQSEPDWQTLPAGTPSKIRELLRQCLQKDASRRLNNVKDVVATIEGVQRGRNRRRLIAIVRRPWFIIPAAAVILLLGFFGVQQYQQRSRVRWVREQAIPQITRSLDSGEIAVAFRLLRRAASLLPDDLALAQIHRDMSVPTEFSTNPPGAEVWATGYAPDDNDWVRLGVTPFTSGELPFGIYRFRIARPGFHTVVGSGEVRAGTRLQFDLDPEGVLPPDMVRVPGGGVTIGQNNAKVKAFLVDRYETTNRQYKEFVDRGGYRKRECWKEDFVQNGRKLSWEEAMQLFVDATGGPGPATWKFGAYPQGQDNYPVGGVSWYEAAAYAEFAGKQLPTIFHWQRAASPGWFTNIANMSNFKGDGPAPVGAYKGIGAFGTMDMAGNVREWCRNEAGGKRIARGGAWDVMDTMAFTALKAYSSWDRSAQNGIRCARYDEQEEAKLQKPVLEAAAGPLKGKPVSDEVFRLYEKALYAYDPMDLDSRVEGIDEENSFWKREKVSFAAAYGNERVLGYLYLPKRATPPYQTILYGHPGMATRLSSPQPGEELLYDFLVKSGRAFFLPVLKGMYQRRYATASSGLNMNRDRLIEQSKDFRRSIDYLMSRPDVDHNRLGVYGLSGFGSLVPILAVGEQRLKAAVLGSVGCSPNRSWFLPEADTLNFLPRFRIPTLMINGRSDFGCPVESCQLPMLRLLGAREPYKKLLHWDGGHFPTDANLVFKEALAWFDRYIGPVK
jgi:serine/threonine protein kinase/formylglycine-generating enzyme required for sulfatase activity/pimeloyl-ACP methyl ester carboxylesterase